MVGVTGSDAGDGEVVAQATSQQMLQVLLDSMTNAVFWKDGESRYLGCNRVFSRFAGVEPEVLIGMSDRDMPWADNAAYPAKWFTDWDRSVLETGEPSFGIVEQLRGADGQYRWIETNKVPLRDTDGRTIGVVGTFEDITDRRRAEEELQRTLDELDERVQKRTSELLRANESLRREVEDRVRLQAEERQQRAYAEALRDTASALSATRDLNEVIKEVLLGVQRLVSNDLAAIVLAETDGLTLARYGVGFEYDLDDEPIPAQRHSVIRGFGEAAGPVIIEHPEESFGPAASVLGARMRVANELVGYVIVESATPGFYTEAHGDRLRAVADLAGAAISNARLATRVSAIAAAEERQRLAQELHDAVNQTLWTAALTSESLLQELDDKTPSHDKAHRLTTLTRGALAEMRSLLIELRPSELIAMPLDELLEHLVTALECRRTLDVSMELEPVDLDEQLHLSFYRIAQEAISNVARHAEARSLRVRLRSEPGPSLTISDDGKGFDIEQVSVGHLGVGIMRERAASVGAHLVVESEPSAGTRVRLWVDG